MSPQILWARSSVLTWTSAGGCTVTLRIPDLMAGVKQAGRSFLPPCCGTRDVSLSSDWDRVKHQRGLLVNVCMDCVSYQHTALAEDSCSKHLANSNSALLHQSCPALYRGPAVSPGAFMQRVSLGLCDFYSIFQCQGHFGRVIHLVLYWLVT